MRCNAAALTVIRKTYRVVNCKHRLLVTETAEEGATSEEARRKQVERDAEHIVYQQLSRYYSRPDGWWTPPELLSRCKHRRFKHTGDISLTHSISGARFEEPP